MVIVDAPSEQHAKAMVVLLDLFKPGDAWFVAKIPDGEPELKLPRDRELTSDEITAIGAVSMRGVKAEMIRIAYEAGMLRRPK